MDSRAIKGLWNVVLSGYPASGKTMLAQRLLAEKPCFARIGVDELRKMFFNENYPCHDEFVVYSMIGEIRDDLLKLCYSVIIDSTAPFNVTRQFLLTTSVKPVNPLLVVISADRDILAKRAAEKFGDNDLISAYDKRWETPKNSFPIFKFKSNTLEEFEDYYARLNELLESETHPFKPEFHPTLRHANSIRKILKGFLGKRA
ncbi:MAG: ATP-binding protein [Candidatus Bathyarchaeota archaeon]|nr:ATP-binding protein [Candidatus Bathyarchaeota archaeon]